MDIKPHAHIIIPYDVFARIIDCIELGRIAATKVNPGIVGDFDFCRKRIRQEAQAPRNEEKIDTINVFEPNQK